MNNLLKANSYISNNKHKTNSQYRPKYHMSPSVGWMNDPNGLIYFGGKYHLYYQCYPYDSVNGVMHWGHFVSDDLYTFRDLGVAIAPEEEGENIFSGGAVEKDGMLYALYTLHYEHNGIKTENIHCAVSAGGSNFKRLGCVFDNETLPENLSRTDFRDPCPVKLNGKYYVFIGGKDVNLNRGVIIVLGGSPERLEYKFTIGPFYELGDMGECPSYCRVDGKDVIIASGCNVKQRGNSFKNVNSSVFIVGEIDFDGGRMKVDFIREIDKGDTFYAPQFISGAGAPVMVGWLEMWGKRYPTHEWGHGWSGAFSVPRTLTYRDGEIYQSPAVGLEKYLTPAQTDKLQNCARITARFNGNGAIEIHAKNGSVRIGCDGGIFLDTQSANNLNGCVRRTDGEYASCEVCVLLDVSCIEVFVDGGKEVISGRIYLDGEYKLKLFGNVQTESIMEFGKRL